MKEAKAVELCRLCAEVNLTDIGDSRIGQALSAAPRVTGEPWPPEPVREVIELCRSCELEDGFQVGLFNRRGVTVRLPTDGELKAVYASLFPDDPAASRPFTRAARMPTDTFAFVAHGLHERQFLPRILLGEYFRDQFLALVERGKASGFEIGVHESCLVTDLKTRDDGVWLSAECWPRRLRFDLAVIATGHAWPDEDEATRSYFPSLWSGLLDRVFALIALEIAAADPVWSARPYHDADSFAHAYFADRWRHDAFRWAEYNLKEVERNKRDRHTVP